MNNCEFKTVQDAAARVRDAKLEHRADVEQQIRAKEALRKQVSWRIIRLLCRRCIPVVFMSMQEELEKIRAGKEQRVRMKAEENILGRLGVRYAKFDKPVL